jgi:hypothetical protein
MIDIYKIQADSFVAQQDFAGRLPAWVVILPAQHIGSAGFVNSNRFGHRILLSGKTDIDVGRFFFIEK